MYKKTGSNQVGTQLQFLEDRSYLVEPPSGKAESDVQQNCRQSHESRADMVELTVPQEEPADVERAGEEKEGVVLAGQHARVTAQVAHHGTATQREPAVDDPGELPGEGDHPHCDVGPAWQRYLQDRCSTIERRLLEQC